MGLRIDWNYKCRKLSIYCIFSRKKKKCVPSVIAIEGSHQLSRFVYGSGFVLAERAQCNPEREVFRFFISECERLRPPLFSALLESLESFWRKSNTFCNGAKDSEPSGHLGLVADAVDFEEIRAENSKSTNDPCQSCVCANESKVLRLLWFSFRTPP